MRIVWLLGLTTGCGYISDAKYDLRLDPDQDGVSIEEDCDNEEEREELLEDKVYAQRLRPILSNHHFMLVTLLLLNSLANEALPIFLDTLVPSWMAILLSVGGVLLVGEILPSAVFTGPRQWEIASHFVPVVRFLQLLFCPIAWPLALVLDAWLGHDDEVINKAKLTGMMRHLRGKQYLQRSATQALNAPTSPARSEGRKSAVINHDEFQMVTGALQMSRINLEDIMTPLDRVYMLSTDTILTMERMACIVAAGFSRIPIYESDPHNIRGIMLVKNLIVISPDDNRRVSTLGLRPPLVVSKTMGLHELLNAFQTGRSHIALVVDSPRKVTAALKSGR